MFFFGFATHIITIVILGVFSLICFFQGVQKNTFESDAEFNEVYDYQIDNSISADVNIDYLAIVSEQDADFSPPVLACYRSFLIYQKPLKELRYLRPDRGPPSI